MHPWHQQHDLSPSPRRPLMALLLLLALLMGLVVDLASRADATHTHVVCPEHGEQIHADAAVVGDIERASPELRSLADLEHGLGCLLTLFAQPQAAQLVPAHPSFVAAAKWTAPPGPTWTDAGIAARRDRLEFAPKTSPPQV